MYVFFDAEFTSLIDPHLWSVGLVTPDGRECYAEIDPASAAGQKLLAQTPWDVREGVLDKFGAFPEAVCESEKALGQRVGKWLMEIAASSPSRRLLLCYDYATDLELLTGALEQGNLWSQVRRVASEANVAELTSSIEGQLAAEDEFNQLRTRKTPLYRHHALADALALRAAWLAVSEEK